MGKSILLVDAGNSAVKWLLSSDLGQAAHRRKAYPDNVTETFFIDSWKGIANPEKVFVSCVAGEHVWQMLNKACQQLWAIHAERVLSVKEDYGLINSYEQPAMLGSDRWCAMIGAYHEVSSDFIIVDCGSAITVDVVSHTGKHIGGYILPGLTMMKNSLGNKTADIKVDSDSGPSSLQPSNSTAGCINAAVHLAAVKFIETVFEQQAKQSMNLKCLLTGGDADLVADLLSIKYVMMPDVVLRGLAYISGIHRNVITRNL